MIGLIGIVTVKSISNDAYDKYATAKDEGYRTEIKSQVQGVLDTLNSLAQDNAASSQETSAMTQELSQTVNRAKNTVDDLSKSIEELHTDVNRFSV